MSESIVLMTIGPLLTIVPNIPPLFVGQAGAISFSSTGAEGLLRWTLVSSDLPGEWDAVLTIDAGVASLEAATLTTPGSYSVRVRLSDATRIPVEQTFGVRIVALPIEVSGTLDEWTVTVAIIDVLTLSGGTGDYVSVTVISGALPAGASVALVGDELQFTGSPTGSGPWSVALRVTDSAGAYLDIPLSGTVGVLPLTITGGPLLDATEGQAYSDTLTIAGGVPPYTLGTVTGMPVGLSASITGSTLTVSGTPAADESDDSPFSLSIEVEDAEADSDVYTQSFVVENDGDPYWANVTSLLHFNGSSGSTTFTDQKRTGWIRGASGTSISTAQSKFGGASLELPGNATNMIYQANHSDDGWDFGSADFTVEAWVRPDVVNKNQTIASNWYGVSAVHCAWLLYITTTGKLQLSYGVGGTNTGTPSSSGITAGVWTHVAVCRQGTTVSYYINGVKDATTYTLTGSLNVPPSDCICIGAASPTTSTQLQFDGYIDELRVTKGVARYNANFTPPDAPFPDE